MRPDGFCLGMAYVTVRRRSRPPRGELKGAGGAFVWLV